MITDKIKHLYISYLNDELNYYEQPEIIEEFNKLTDDERISIIMSNLKDRRREIILTFIMIKFTNDDLNREIGLHGTTSYSVTNYDYEITNYIEFIEYQMRMLNDVTIDDDFINYCLLSAKNIRNINSMDKEYMSRVKLSGFRLDWNEDGDIQIQFFCEQ